MFHRQMGKGGRTMKKIAVIAIAVFFSLAGLCYAQDLAGPINVLNLKIVYEEELPATQTLKDGVQLITVMSGLKQVVSGNSVYKPAIYVKTDPSTGLLSEILISWIGPNINDPFYNKRILAIACSGGNTSSSNSNPGLPVPTDGTVSTKRQLPVKNTPATRTDSYQAVAGCYVCPDGFQFDTSNPPNPTGLCNDLSSYVSGYIIYSGQITKDLSTKDVLSVSITGTIGAGGFNYIGEDWAVNLNPKTLLSGKSCNTYSGDFPYCNAILTGTFNATLSACPSGSNWSTCFTKEPKNMVPLSFSFSPCSSGGDSITVSGLTGTSATIKPGAQYEICGTYTLNSRDSAQIVAANYASLGHEGSKGSYQEISKGSGSYCVSFTVENVEPGFEKRISIGFYPWPSGNQFFGSGYGCDDIVLQ